MGALTKTLKAKGFAAGERFYPKEHNTKPSVIGLYNSSIPIYTKRATEINNENANTIKS